ncbi:MAG: 3-dehydroquinate synthase [Saprospiraceae bacterium]|nr:3-dehydroquinate synthase [Saprospiraceae bacterium]
MELPPSLLYKDSCWHDFEQWLDKNDYTSFFILCDDNTHKYCLDYVLSKKIISDPKIILISQGELSKSFQKAEEVLGEMLKHHIDRNSLCIGLGGGVICDLLGFCSSIVLRGLDCVYIPTSLMAMADASIGGKTGVNYLYWKNQIGTFYNPKKIIIDFKFLNTLSIENLKNGFVEMIKHSILQGKSAFEQIKKVDLSILDEFFQSKVLESISYKSSVVSKDFYEVGERKILNFGHTLGHAIESLLLNKSEIILHGEAIALGMILELRLSGRYYYNDEDYFLEIIKYLELFKVDYSFTSSHISEILDILNFDKKKYKNDIRFSLLYDMGDCRINISIEREFIKKILQKHLPGIND